MPSHQNLAAGPLVYHKQPIGYAGSKELISMTPQKFSEVSNLFPNCGAQN